MEQPSFTAGLSYWDSTEATNNGVLGGYGATAVPRLDASSSRLLILSLLPALSTIPPPHRTPSSSSASKPKRSFRALDCGAGIGRVTQSVLLPLFDRIDLVEPVTKFVHAAKVEAESGKGGWKWLKEKDARKGVRMWVGGLQHFDPGCIGVGVEALVGKEEVKDTVLLAKMGVQGLDWPDPNVRGREEDGYDLIMIQWCVGHLSDEEFVQFLQRSQKALRKTEFGLEGYIVVKENICANQEGGKGRNLFDSEDSSITRSDQSFRNVFEKAGLTLIRREVQQGFPKELFPDLQDAESDTDLGFSTVALEHLSLSPPASSSPAPVPSIPYSEISLSTLLATLPPLLSFTPLHVPLSSPRPAVPASVTERRSTTLLRRDLFDARFQVLAQENDGEESFTANGDVDADVDVDLDADVKEKGQEKEKGKGRETFVDQETDLVKGVYEGGLKTWECSLDLVDALAGEGAGTIRGKSMFEVGCGTALPSCSIFAELLAVIREEKNGNTGASEKPVTRIHLQDYNSQVLSLITLPNLLLTYAQHLASLSLSSQPSSSPNDTLSVSNSFSSQPGEIEITPEFLSSFSQTLLTSQIDLRFFHGSWSTFSSVPLQIASDDWDGQYDLVLTSETIYSLDSLPPLLALLRDATRREGECWVACKRIYFGVGGGEMEFRKRVEEMGGTVTTVWGEEDGRGRKGVGRVVLRVQWE